MAQLLSNSSFKDMGLPALSCYDVTEEPSAAPSATVSSQSPSGVNSAISKSPEMKSASEASSQALQELDDLLGF